ncbi:MAG: helix-turn-helix domain-containing protein [Pseudomonadota bacterium]
MTMENDKQAAVYDTAEVKSRDRFAFWRDAVCDSYVQLGCEADDVSGFDGRIEIARHSLLSISKVGGKAHTAERRARDIGASSEAYFLLSLQTERTARVSQFGQSTLLQPGDMALYASTDPYRLELHDDFSQMVVQLPAEMLLSRLPDAHLTVARRIDGQNAIGRLVRDSILAFTEHIDHDSPIVRSLVQETLIDLMATGLASLDGGTADLSSPERQALLRARSFIQNNIADADLDRHRVANAVGLSVRRLNAIFAEAQGSISQCIRQARLDAIKADLRDHRFDAMTIAEIAFRNGVSNMQHLSQTFKAHTGMSPRAYRRLSDVQ